MYRKVDLEHRVARAVAEARGSSFAESTDAQQDGWLVEPNGTRVAVEVVIAFPETDATNYAREYQAAAREARRQDASFTVHEGRGIVVGPADLLPVSTKPIDPLPGIREAIAKKSGAY